MCTHAQGAKRGEIPKRSCQWQRSNEQGSCQRQRSTATPRFVYIQVEAAAGSGGGSSVDSDDGSGDGSGSQMGVTPGQQLWQ